MIKVVHISTSPMGGAGVAAYRLHKGLLKSGLCASVFICQYAGPYSNDADVIQVKKRALTFIERLQRKFKMYVNKPDNFNSKLSLMPGKYEIATWPKTNYAVELQPEVLDADIIHLHWVSGLVNYPTFFKKLKGKKIVWTLHDMNPFMGIFHYRGDEECNPALKQLNQQALDIKTKGLKNSHIHIVALSNWIATEARNNPAFKKFQYHNIPNGVNCSVFAPQSKSLTQKELGITDDEHVLLFISENIDNYRKGIDILIGALDMVKLSKPLRVVSVGKGNLQLPAHIRYTAMGAIFDEEKLAKVYSCSDVFIIPSREDNLPNVMLEAFACGVPVISFNTGGMKQWITATNGLLYEQATPDSLAKALNEFFNTVEAGIDHNAIRALALEKFDTDVQISNMCKFYNDLISK